MEMSFFGSVPGPDLAHTVWVRELRCQILSNPYTTSEAKRQGRPPMVQSKGRFKTTHTGWYPSAKAYEEVRRFETTLYRALFRGQSKKRYLHAHQSLSFMYNPEAKRRGYVLKSYLA